MKPLTAAELAAWAVSDVRPRRAPRKKRKAASRPASPHGTIYIGQYTRTQYLAPDGVVLPALFKIGHTKSLPHRAGDYNRRTTSPLGDFQILFQMPSANRQADEALVLGTAAVRRIPGTEWVQAPLETLVKIVKGTVNARKRRRP